MIRESLPNYLSIFRLVCALPIMGLLLVQYEFEELGAERAIDVINFSFYFICFLTDIIDGYLARRWGTVSSAGILLDPIADKFLALGPLYILIPLRGVHPLPVLLISLREIGIMGLRTFAVKEGILIAASRSGKLKTTVLNASLLLILFNTDTTLRIGMIILWIASLITVYSGIEYVYSFRKMREKK